jgi:hypothetical protein
MRSWCSEALMHPREEFLMAIEWRHDLRVRSLIGASPAAASR